jgi:hypothetical protein
MQYLRETRIFQPLIQALSSMNEMSVMNKSYPTVNNTFAEFLVLQLLKVAIVVPLVYVDS